MRETAAQCPQSANLIQLQDDAREHASQAEASFASRIAILQAVPVAHWVYDIDHCRIIWANHAGLQVWSAETLEELRARDLALDMSPKVAKRLKQFQLDFETGQKFSEYWTLYPKGTPQPFLCTFSGIRLDDTRMAMLVTAQGDTEYTPETLRSTQALLHTSVMISLYTPAGHLLYENPAAREARPKDAHSLFDRFLNPHDLETFLSSLAESGEHDQEVQYMTADGQAWYELKGAMSRDAATGEPAILTSATDISERKHAEERIHYLAHHDALTGLLNRSFLQNAFYDHLQHVRASNRKTGFLFIDLDRFKTINDSLGHDIGDQLLIEVANRLKTTIRKDDFVARLGGDEFVIAFDDVQDRQQISAIADKIQQSLCRPYLLNQQSLQISASIGSAIYPDDGETIDVLMKQADLAMYQAKANGRNQHCAYMPFMHEHAKTRLNMEQKLHRAVALNELELYYQPKLDMHTNRLIGAEALLRWNHPDLGIISPDLFMEIAEESGAIEPIGTWVLEQATRQQACWRAAGLDIKLAINISPRQFAMRDFVRHVEALMHPFGYTDDLFEFEITESMLMSEGTTTLATLKTLARFGISLAIDDFGTGFSNLAYLQRYPINSLKIDKTFVQDDDNHAIVALITNMGHMLNMAIVAEGVETEDQRQRLQAMNCDAYQGYLYARPLSATDMTALMNTLRNGP